ncbi:ankyrin repeat domain-containing 12-like [Brachionus plicatilis]|uniref:Ankyrin repeat domain-containing 12-like n=1 Tax=Brachionus plicatilis TaxID=10195 RepID=A0A3M7R3X0_BRAPC|nr:ankyrin repeat domain-containing 12-like [Brachionus plicatilis]
MNNNENPSVSVDKPNETEARRKPKKPEREEGEIDDEEDEYEHYSEEEADKSKEGPKTDNSRPQPNHDSYDEDDDEFGISNKRLKIDEGEEQAHEAKNLEHDADFSSASSAKSAFSASSVKTELSAISSTSLPLSASSQKLDEDARQKNADKLKVPPLKIICSNPNGGLPYIKCQEAKSEPNHVNTRSKSVLKTNRTASPVAHTKTSGGRRNAVGRSSPSVKLRSSSPSSDSSTLCSASADSLIRRKLRSHTKQLQNGDGTLRKSSSSSPVDETEDDARAEAKILVADSHGDGDATVSAEAGGQAHERIMGNSAANCMKKFYEIRNVVTRRKEAQMRSGAQLQLPKNISEFLIIKKNYLIRHNCDVKQSVTLLTPPKEMSEELKQLFVKQENERHKLRLRHRIEQDKLIILYEQEVLRCFTKQSRFETNQTIPLSFCAIIKDAEVYSLYKNELATERLNQLMTPVSPDDILYTNLNKVKQKFLIFKNDMIKRQLNESDSLFAVQKMDFQSKIRELSLSSENLNVPIVNVNNKFYLFDPALQFSFQRVLPSTGSHLVSLVPLTTMFT